MSKRLRIVLLRNVHGLGKKGDVLQVAPGYAKNALLPSGAAVPADAGSVQAAAAEAGRGAKREHERVQAETKLRDRLRGMQLHLTAAANAQGVLYGGIPVEHIVAAFAQHGVQLAAKHIRTVKPLRTAGAHQVDVVFPGWTAQVPLTVQAAPAKRSV